MKKKEIDKLFEEQHINITKMAGAIVQNMYW